MANNHHESLVRRFWTHVFEKPELPAVFVKNMAQSETRVVGGAHPHIIPMVARVKPKAYRTLTWDDSGHLVAEIMAYLTANGFQKGDRVAILAWNSPEWVWTDLAVQSLGGVTVPIYPNTSSEGACDILLDAGARFLLSDDLEQLQKAYPIRTHVSDFHTALFAHALSDAPDYTGRNASPDTPYGFHPELKFGAGATRVFNTVQYEHICYDRFGNIDPSKTATIIYSSGSTGKQKGVPLTHGNIASACQSLVRHGFNFSESDIYLSYLPMAHVYERVNGMGMCLWNAVPTAFCRTDELADTLPIVRPTILVGVPAVWRKIKDKITHELSTATGIRAKMIAWAFDETKVGPLHGMRKRLAQAIVFRTIRGKLGGRLRLLMSGGAAINPELIVFFNKLGLNLRQGYGMTETTGGIAAETDAENRPGSVGRMIDCVEVKFVVNEDNPDPKKQIIFLRGDCIIETYHNLPDVNAKSFDGEGWFNTGDLGWMDEDGYLYITGRKKREGKTQQGKYYSPENIESAFDGSAIVQYVVPIGDDRPFIGALIFVNQVTAAALLAKSNPAASHTDALLAYSKNTVVQQAVAEAVTKANTTLEHWEQVGQYEIVPAEATVANGLLTPTLKIRSEKAMEKYADLIDLIFSRKR